MHDSLSFRLSTILVKLNQGEKLFPKQLAEVFNVDVRTIQRDINERLTSLPIIKVDNYYQLEQSYLGRLDTKKLQAFADVTGIQGLLPKFDAYFINKLFDLNEQGNLYVQTTTFETFDAKLTNLFNTIETAIKNHQVIAFDYQKRDESQQHYPAIQPYQLTNRLGVWYLSAVDHGKIKSFALGRIKFVTVSSDTFQPDNALKQTIENADSVWHGETFRVVLKVSARARQFFKRRQLVPQQTVLDETDTCLLIESHITHADQLLPIVQYWIPYVEIVEPMEMQNQLVEQLQDFLQQATQ